MRCTKCHYLSFEPEPRCRNCGHDLSLEQGGEFSVSEDAVGARGDIARAAASVGARPRIPAVPAASRSSSALATAELPLFMQSIPGVAGLLADDEERAEDLEPLVKVPARPRVPVAVRKATPDPARLRAKYGLSPSAEPDLWSNLKSNPLDQVDIRDEETDLHDLPLVTSPGMPWPGTPESVSPPPASGERVGAAPRLVAASIDAALLAGISAVVLYLTLRITGLSVQEVGLLPALPLIALFMLLAGGYLLMFTAAGGQTVGKMAMNIRVVGASRDPLTTDRVTMSQALVRSLAALSSVLTFGAGFAPVLVGAGRAVHDRIAHTRVVRL